MSDMKAGDSVKETREQEREMPVHKIVAECPTGDADVDDDLKEIKEKTRLHLGPAEYVAIIMIGCCL